MTREEMDAIPEWQDFIVETDQLTGISTRIRIPQQFMVKRGDVLFYTDRVTGVRWEVVEDSDGRQWKRRF